MAAMALESDGLISSLNEYLVQLLPLLSKLTYQFDSGELGRTSTVREYLGPACDTFKALMKTARSLKLHNSMRCRVTSASDRRFWTFFSEMIGYGVCTCASSTVSLEYMANFSALVEMTFACRKDGVVPLPSADLVVLIESLVRQAERRRTMASDCILGKIGAFTDVMAGLTDKGAEKVGILVDRMKAFHGCKKEKIELLEAINDLRVVIIGGISEGVPSALTGLAMSCSALEILAEEVVKSAKMEKMARNVGKFLCEHSVSVMTGPVSLPKSIWEKQLECERKCLGLSSMADYADVQGMLDNSVSGELRMISEDLFSDLDSYDYGDCLRHYIECIRQGDAVVGEALMKRVAKNVIVAKISKYGDIRVDPVLSTSTDPFLIGASSVVSWMRRLVCSNEPRKESLEIIEVVIHLLEVAIYVLPLVSKDTRSYISKNVAEVLPSVAFFADALKKNEISAHFREISTRLLAEPDKSNMTLRQILTDGDKLCLSDTVHPSFIDRLNMVEELDDIGSIFVDECDTLIAILQFLAEYEEFLQSLGSAGCGEWKPFDAMGRCFGASVALLSSLQCEPLKYVELSDEFYRGWIVYITDIRMGHVPPTFVDNIPFCDYSGAMRDALEALECMRIAVHDRVMVSGKSNEYLTRLKDTLNSLYSAFVYGIAVDSYSTNKVLVALKRMTDLARVISAEMIGEIHKCCVILRRFVQLLDVMLILSTEISAFMGKEYNHKSNYFRCLLLVVKSYLIEDGEWNETVEQMRDFDSIRLLMFEKCCDARVFDIMSSIGGLVNDIDKGYIIKQTTSFIANAVAELARDENGPIRADSKYVLLEITDDLYDLRGRYTAFDVFYATSKIQKRMQTLQGIECSKKFSGLLEQEERRYFVKCFFSHAKLSLDILSPDRTHIGLPVMSVHEHSFSELCADVTTTMDNIEVLRRRIQYISCRCDIGDTPRIVENLKDIFVEQMGVISCISEYHDGHRKLKLKRDELRAEQEKFSEVCRAQLDAIDRVEPGLEHAGTELYECLRDEEKLWFSLASVDKETVRLTDECSHLQERADRLAEMDCNETGSLSGALEMRVGAILGNLKADDAPEDNCDDIRQQIDEITKENARLMKIVNALECADNLGREAETRLLMLRGPVSERMRMLKQSGAAENEALRMQIAETRRSIERLNKLSQRFSHESATPGEGMCRMRQSMISGRGIDYSTASEFVDMTVDWIESIRKKRK